jgi:hypothetical protein
MRDTSYQKAERKSLDCTWNQHEVERQIEVLQSYSHSCVSSAVILLHKADWLCKAWKAVQSRTELALKTRKTNYKYYL